MLDAVNKIICNVSHAYSCFCTVRVVVIIYRGFKKEKLYHLIRLVESFLDYQIIYFICIYLRSWVPVFL